jgi:hypothetical protein
MSKKKDITIKEFESIYEMFLSYDKNENLLDELISTYKPNKKLYCLASLFLLSDHSDKLSRICIQEELLKFFNIPKYESFEDKVSKIIHKINTDKSCKKYSSVFNKHYCNILIEYMTFSKLINPAYQKVVIKNN